MSSRLALTGLRRMARGHAAPLRRFLDWWLGELRAAIPAALRGYLDRTARVVTVSPRHDELVILVAAAEGKETIARVRLDDPLPAEIESVRERIRDAGPEFGGCIVELPATRVLRRRSNLPAATEHHLGDVLKFELDRLTPFSYGEACVASRIVERDTANGRIVVELFIARRDEVDRILDRLAQCGLEATAVRPQNGESQAAAIDLLPTDRRPGRAWRHKLVPAGLAAAAAVLATLALILPAAMHYRDAAELDRQIAALQPTAREAADLRDEMLARRREQSFFADLRRRSPPVVALIDEVTRVVPDDTWVSRFEIRGSVLRIHGESESASSLIALLEGSDRLYDVAFASPVTKNPRTSNDRFSIEARIASGESP